MQAHTSNLANCVFLPPGSAVVELIQRFWSWMALDKSFKDQTDQLADVHHFAWRAHTLEQTVYLNPRDGDRCASLQCPRVSCVLQQDAASQPAWPALRFRAGMPSGELCVLQRRHTGTRFHLNRRGKLGCTVRLNPAIDDNLCILTIATRPPTTCVLPEDTAAEVARPVCISTVPGAKAAVERCLPPQPLTVPRHSCTQTAAALPYPYNKRI